MLSKSKSIIEKSFKEFNTAREIIFLDRDIRNKLMKLANDCSNVIQDGGRLYFAGNGGSFADAMHITAEFIGKMGKFREPIPAFTLGSNFSTLTSIGNDLDFIDIFKREFDALVTKKDLIIILSTSGNSKNLLNLVDSIRRIKCKSFAFLGKGGGELASHIDGIIVPIERTERIQEIHIFLGHVLCELIENNLGF